jgi:riboflavin kinase/FMN adenylyltransferase
VHRARRKEGRSVVVTFEPHPKNVVGKGPVSLLTTSDERTARIASSGIDLMLIVQFTVDVSRLDPVEFYTRYVVRGIGVGDVIVGYDHRYGRDRGAGIEELMRLGKEHAFSVTAIQPFRVDDEVVSSTAIRAALSRGDVLRAARLLGYRYELRGHVIRGDGRGKTLGYATANLEPSPEKLIPGHGVYLVGVQLRGAAAFGMLNIGVRPTVSSNPQQTVEVHIFDFDEDIYGEEVTIEFIKKLRDEQRFSSIAELTAQLHRDKEVSREYVRDIQKFQVS